MSKLPLPESDPAPFRIGVTRGPLVESTHAVSGAIVDATGALRAHWGDIDRPIFWRSAIKPIQAIPLLESGAAEASDLGDREIALACASHNGEAMHVEAVGAWLARVGLGKGDLECGCHWPYHEESVRAMARRGEEPTTLHNNCSGKHAGMLTTAHFLKEETRGYVGREHSVQRRVTGVLSDLAGMALDRAPSGTDGCSIPTIAFPARAAALAAARFAAPDRLPATRAAACRRIAAAIAAAPEMIAGSGRMCSALVAATGGRVLAKVGAEGCYLAFVPDAGVGIALKSEDGTTRAAEAALAIVLARFGYITDAELERLRSFAAPVLRNRNGIEVGRIGLALSDREIVQPI
ncbi:asparaginase [Oceanibacterium hippocampi]|uniref:L-asparaginase II n=1 Tax=Oceanibacterium hippocampi TaxID=745714 RepID=A0A1Y5R9K4_9PROT|nr:asparaginase [Oceanibacterium hippocampi]SLN12309.1 L-asparaginase II [Oceanibacterium hippocampi]